MLTILQDGNEYRARDQRAPTWFWADNAILSYIPQIGPLGFALYMILCAYARNETGRCWRSFASLAKEMGVSEPTVRKYADKLVEAGLILMTAREHTSRAGKPISDSTIYTVLDLSASKEKGVVNDVTQGGKARLPGVVNDVYPNYTNINYKNLTTDSAASKIDAPDPTPESQNPEPPKAEPPSSKEKDIQPSIPQGGAKEKPRNLIFDALATCVFGLDLTDKAGVAASGGRIGRIRKALLKVYPDATADDICAQAEWYHRENQKVNMPRDPEKYLDWFRQWKATKTHAAPLPLVDGMCRMNSETGLWEVWNAAEKVWKVRK